MKRTDILEVTSRKLAPFIMMFGFYVVTHGHLSPGGGFQGGVVLASGVMLLLLCHEPGRVQRVFSLYWLAMFEALAFMTFLVFGIAGIIVKGDFLAVLQVNTTGDSTVPGFILALNMVIGLKVGTGISMICFYLFGEN